MLENSPSINFRLEDQQHSNQKSQPFSYNLSNTHMNSTQHKDMMDDEFTFKFRKLQAFNTALKMGVQVEKKRSIDSNNLKTEEFFEEFDKNFKVEFKSPPKLPETENEYLTKPLLEIFEEQQQQMMQSKLELTKKCSKLEDEIAKTTIRFKKYNKQDKITTIKRKIQQHTFQKEMISTPPLIPDSKKLIFKRILSHPEPSPTVKTASCSLNKKNRTLVSMNYVKSKQLDDKNIFKIPLQDMQPFCRSHIIVEKQEKKFCRRFRRESNKQNAIMVKC